MDWNFIGEIAPTILEGLWITLSLFAWSMLFSTILGLMLALMRLSQIAPLRWFSIGFGWFFRGVPLLLLLFYAFFALPELGDNGGMKANIGVIVGLALVTAADQSEAFRSGIIAVDSGQFEAAEALGMTKLHSMRKIVLPQAARIIIPPFMGNAINTMKQTSLATVITVPEMTLLAQRIIASEFKAVEPLFALAIIFLALTTVLVLAPVGVERAFRLKT